MDLSIIILNYKSRGLTRQCVKGIIAANLGLEHEIIIVDNASQDSSPELFRQEFSQVTVVEAEENRGFAAGNNIGIKKAQGRYILILNPDVAVDSGALEKLVSFMDRSPRVGIAGPKLINPNGTIQHSCCRFHKWYTPILRRSPLGRLGFGQRHLGNFLMGDFDHCADREVDWLLGACLIIRKTALEKIGLLDENYFLYMEDTDFCRRSWENGYKVNYIANVELVHYHKRESAANPGITGIFSYPTRIHIKSFAYYCKKFRGKENPRLTNTNHSI